MYDLNKNPNLNYLNFYKTISLSKKKKLKNFQIVVSLVVVHFLFYLLNALSLKDHLNDYV